MAANRNAPLLWNFQRTILRNIGTETIGFQNLPPLVAHFFPPFEQVSKRHLFERQLVHLLSTSEINDIVPAMVNILNN